MNSKICKRCLLEDLDEIDLLKNVNDYINLLRVDECVDDISYKKRLETCKSCDYLINGSCRFCGCFVQIRAKKVNQTCPCPDMDKWI